MLNKEAFKERVFKDFSAIWTKPDEKLLQEYADVVAVFEERIPEDLRNTIYAAHDMLLHKIILNEFPVPLILNEMCKLTDKDPNEILNKLLRLNVGYLKASLDSFGKL